MKISIIIVNYRSASLIFDCLQTVFRQEDTGEMEVIVVDNFSQDDSERIICGAFPQVHWIQMGYNSGFARANNAGMRAAKGEVILLLNPDTLNENNAIEACYERFRSSDYVACGVQLLNPDRTPQISGNYFMKGGLNHLLPLPYTGSILKTIALLFRVKKPNVPQATGVVEVDWINGAFLMVRRSAIEKAGLMDEDFFLYAEETEWCARLRKTGKLCIYGDYHVVHLQGATTGEAFNSSGKGYMNVFDKKGLQLMVSNSLRVRKQFGIGWFLFHLLAFWGTVPVFFIGLLISTIIRLGKPPYSWHQFAGYCRNVADLSRYAGRIIRNRPYFYKLL